jgi:hypothetical protein
MKMILSSVPPGLYTTTISFQEKEQPKDTFHLAAITIDTPAQTAHLADIHIPDWKLTQFEKTLERIKYTGRARFEIKTHNREEFILFIQSVGMPSLWIADVFLKNKSDFIHVKYQLDPSLLGVA